MQVMEDGVRLTKPELRAMKLTASLVRHIATAHNDLLDDETAEMIKNTLECVIKGWEGGEES